MKKGLITVFIVLGILVAGLCIWAFCFGDGFNSIFQGFAHQINNIWRGLTGGKGDDANILDENTEIFGEAQDVADAGAAAGVDW